MTDLKDLDFSEPTFIAFQDQNICDRIRGILLESRTKSSPAKIAAEYNKTVAGWCNHLTEEKVIEYLKRMTAEGQHIRGENGLWYYDRPEKLDEVENIVRLQDITKKAQGKIFDELHQVVLDIIEKRAKKGFDFISESCLKRRLYNSAPQLHHHLVHNIGFDKELQAKLREEGFQILYSYSLKQTRIIWTDKNLGL